MDGFLEKLFARGNSYWLTRFVILGLLGLVYTVAFLVAARQRVPPILVFWLFRWLGFRIMVGAGLIKIRGDECWRDLTCMFYHYETQPIPSPISRYLHFAPQWFHKIETFWNHFIELIVPWFSFGPRAARHIAGALLVLFQIFLIISGNLSFLNYLTIIPFLACFDDTLLRHLLPMALVKRAERAAQESQPSLTINGVAVVLSILVAYLSIDPVLNLVSPRQAMNTAFNRFDLVNTYGAFGTVGRERDEIVFEGTEDAVITGDTKWKEYEFVAKPGDPDRRPSFIAPYQPRIDWQIWFAAMASPGDYPWTFHFVWQLLHNDPDTLSLLANNPFPDKPPHYIRARLYRYRVAPVGEKGRWRRGLISEWRPALSTDHQELRRLMGGLEWYDHHDRAHQRDESQIALDHCEQCTDPATVARPEDSEFAITVVAQCADQLAHFDNTLTQAFRVSDQIRRDCKFAVPVTRRHARVVIRQVNKAGVPSKLIESGGPSPITDVCCRHQRMEHEDSRRRFSAATREKVGARNIVSRKFRFDWAPPSQ